MVNCALCHNAPATVFCFNDNAQLCTGCDVQIHKTNKLTLRHQRVHLCEMCEGNPRHAVVFCAEDKAYLCQECDVSIHKMNSVAGNHERRPVGVFTEEQLAGAGATSGSLNDDQFLDLLDTGGGGDAFVGLPDISEDGGLWDPNAAHGGESNSFLADPNAKADKNARGSGNNNAKQSGSQGSRGSGGSGDRAGSSQASGAAAGGGQRRSVDGVSSGGAMGKSQVKNEPGHGDGDFSLSMDDYAHLDRMGNMDDLLGPILDDGALGGPGGFIGYEGPGGGSHHMAGGSFHPHHPHPSQPKQEPHSPAGGIGRQFGQIAQSLSGERGGTASGNSGGSGNGGKPEVKSEPSRGGQPAGMNQMPPQGWQMHHPMAPGTHGMPPPPMMGGPGGGPGGPMPPGMQAMAPGTHGTMGGHGPPPGAGPVQGPNGVMYFPGPQHPLLHLANGGSNKPPSRLERLRRWKEKRKNRNFNKKIRYQSRKVCADNRPRIKGKFVKVGSTPDLGAMDLLGEDDGPTQAGPEGLSDVEEDSFDSDPPPPPGALARTAGLRRDGGLSAAMSVPDLSRLG